MANGIEIRDKQLEINNQNDNNSSQSQWRQRRKVVGRDIEEIEANGKVE